MTLLVGIVLGNFLLNNLSIPPLDSISLIYGKTRMTSDKQENLFYWTDLDRHTRKPTKDDQLHDDAIAPVSDLDLALVNRVLYSVDKN